MWYISYFELYLKNRYSQSNSSLIIQDYLKNLTYFCKLVLGFLVNLNKNHCGTIL